MQFEILHIFLIKSENPFLKNFKLKCIIKNSWEKRDISIKCRILLVFFICILICVYIGANLIKKERKIFVYFEIILIFIMKVLKNNNKLKYLSTYGKRTLLAVFLNNLNMINYSLN